jgi:DNA-binding SARP family transcriptional activator
VTLRLLLDLLNETNPDAAVKVCELYAGKLLEQPLAAGRDFEDWLAFERERLRERVTDVVSAAIAPAGGLDDAQREYCARQLLEIDPCHEAAYRALMQLAAGRGDISRVRNLFDQCKRRLQFDLGARPADSTVTLWRLLITEPTSL